MDLCAPSAAISVPDGPARDDPEPVRRRQHLNQSLSDAPRRATPTRLERRGSPSYACSVRACPTCTQESPDGFRFCGHCGSPLEATEPRPDVRKTVSILFCDLCGFTALGDQLDPEALRARLRRYHAELRAVLERHGATVEKFIGDAVMAVFGVPRAHEDDALRAVRAAAEIRDAVAALGLEVRIGVNTGEVVVGEGEPLATGDAVNIAARLEQAAAPGQILLGTETQRLTRDAAKSERVEVTAKGKPAPLAAFRLASLDPSAAAFARRLDAPLVGRARELGLLEREFERAADDDVCRMVTLLGTAGVGKSRLVEELVNRIGGRASVLRGRCLHYGEGITYWPLVEVLLQLGADPETVLALPSPIEAALESRKLLEAHAADRPLLLVFDDIHWGESTFLDLVEHLADASRAAPILLLCVARPELLETRTGWGDGRPNSTTTVLEPLANDDASQLIDNLPGGAGLTPGTRRRIIEASGGNPLFVEEMLLMLQDRDGADGDVEVPPTIRALLQARLELLPDEERAVAERGSVEGQVFHRRPVSELAPPRLRAELDLHLEQLVRKELIRGVHPTMRGDGAFRFRHLLIRDAAYESLSKRTRADLHEGLALWLEEHATLIEQDEIVGYHLEQAVRYRRELERDDDGLAQRAAQRLAAAGSAALGRSDVAAGTNLLGRAVALYSPGDEERLRLLPELGLAVRELGRYSEMAAFAEELDAAGSERWHAHAALLRARHASSTGTRSLEEERPAIIAARETFERLGEDAAIARALEFEAAAEWNGCRAAAAAALYLRALPFAERAGNTRVVTTSIGRLAGAYALGPTPVEEAERQLRELLEVARGNIVAEAGACRGLGRLAAMRGDFEAARELFQRGREPLKEAGLTVLYAAAAHGAADIEDLARNFPEAANLLRNAFEQLDELGEHAFASTLAALLARALLRLGRDGEAARWLARARELSPRHDVTTLATADYVDALLASRGGERERALELARRAVEQAEATDFWGVRGGAYEALAEVLAGGGDADEARAAERRAIEIYEAKGVTVEAERARERYRRKIDAPAQRQVG
jgi:class 3 adenylate cyclase/tetratricopeptide (TPR) repeat protein